MQVNADTMLSTKELGKTQARAKGIMNISKLEQAKSLLKKIIKDFSFGKPMKDNDLEQVLIENFETLVSGYEALSNAIKIYKEIK